jgi:hypothetical protein
MVRNAIDIAPTSKVFVEQILRADIVSPRLNTDEIVPSLLHLHAFLFYCSNNTWSVINSHSSNHGTAVLRFNSVDMSMKWVTWDQALFTALVCLAVVFILRRHPLNRTRSNIIAWCTELALISGLYTLWRIAMTLPLDLAPGAIQRASQINDVQQWLHIPTELSLQHFVLKYEWLAQATNAFYAIVHVPATVVFMIWLFWRHREAYSRWRNSLAMLTASCLVIRYLRVAPPRFLPELGYVDLATRYGLSVYGPVGTGVSDQFAAMPSIHVGWAALVSFGIVAASTSKWRWIFMAHLALTVYAVTATGNHWWLDSIAAIALLGIALRFDSYMHSRNLLSINAKIN